MVDVSFALVLSQHLPPGVPEAALRRAVHMVARPTVEALAASPKLQAGLCWSGPVLEAVEAVDRALLDQLKGLVADGRVEMVLSGWSNPFLSGLPEADAVEQLRVQAAWIEQKLGRAPRAVLPAEGAWDPILPRIMGRAGMDVALFDDRAAFPGDPIGGGKGWYVAERDGHVVRMVPYLGLFSRALRENPPMNLLRALARRGQADLPAAGAADAVERVAARVGYEAYADWARALCRLLSDQAHWLKTCGPSAFLAMAPRAGRVHLPSWCPPPLLRWSLTSEQAERQLAYEKAVAAGDANVKRGPPFPRARGWEALLDRYPEANRLHKRARRAAIEVERLRQAMDSPAARDPRRLQELRSAHGVARKRLLAAQSADPLWHGPDGGIYNAALRHAAWLAIADAEAEVQRTLGEAETIRHEVADLDCDGSEKVLIRTPFYSAIVDPIAGGTLGAWAVPGLGNLVNTMTRVDEAVHQALEQALELPALVGPDDKVAPKPLRLAGEAPRISEDDDALALLPPPDPSDAALGSALGADKCPRLAFIDRFLGPQVTLANLARGMHPEAADFAGQPYALESSETDTVGRVVVTLARDGQVQQGDKTRLARIVKRFVFRKDEPALMVRYELSNRLNDPVRGTFAVEINLNVDSTVGPDQYIQLAQGRTVGFSDVGEIQRSNRISLVDENHRYKLHIGAGAPFRLWHYPIVAVSRKETRFAHRFQGVCLVLAWDVQLWGSEKYKLDLNLQLEQSGKGVRGRR